MTELNYTWSVKMTDNSFAVIAADELVILPNGAKFIKLSEESNLPDNVELSPDLADLMGVDEDYVIAFIPIDRIEYIQILNQLNGDSSIKIIK